MCEARSRGPWPGIFSLLLRTHKPRNTGCPVLSDITVCVSSNMQSNLRLYANNIPCCLRNRVYWQSNGYLVCILRNGISLYHKDGSQAIRNIILYEPETCHPAKLYYFIPAHSTSAMTKAMSSDRWLTASTWCHHLHACHRNHTMHTYTPTHTPDNNYIAQ